VFQTIYLPKVPLIYFSPLCTPEFTVLGRGSIMVLRSGAFIVLGSGAFMVLGSDVLKGGSEKVPNFIILHELYINEAKCDDFRQIPNFWLDAYPRRKK
jgi:hypothetical protein